MKTYKLSSTSKKKLEALADTSAHMQLSVVKYRAVMLAKRELTREELKGVTVEDLYQGDCFQDIVPWVSTNIVNELHTEFLQSKRPGPARRTAILKALIEGREAVAEAEAELAKAKSTLESRSRTVVRNFGKGCIQINGDTYDPSHIRENVMFLKRIEK
jgi:hypothetical protein